MGTGSERGGEKEREQNKKKWGGGNGIEEENLV
jgi:hypothetical protein